MLKLYREVAHELNVIPMYEHDFHTPNGTREASPDTTPDGQVTPETHHQVQADLEQRFTRYLHAVEDLGVVQSVMVGRKPCTREGYLWHVFAEDFSLVGMTAETIVPFEDLNQMAADLQRDLSLTLPVRVSHINPSALPALQQECAREHIEIDIVHF